MCCSDGDYLEVEYAQFCGICAADDHQWILVYATTVHTKRRIVFQHKRMGVKTA